MEASQLHVLGQASFKVERGHFDRGVSRPRWQNVDKALGHIPDRIQPSSVGLIRAEIGGSSSTSPILNRKTTTLPWALDEESSREPRERYPEYRA